ncbi:hypothetical protein GUJ93_ZPchr0002g26824 [Zizania palustris]|uniref:Secreted protein n=1 Tax=Zizania palustris TaxID=103762 RepID=A0A8J5RJL4_ZIZPA|nr:hypothetical protein GUJ93_ZPchr0002g26824 [Zizania palustris]
MAPGWGELPPLALLMLFICPCVHDHLIQRGRALHGDVRAEWCSQADGENLYLLGLRDARVPTGQRHEFVAILIDGAITMEKG